IYLEQNRQRNDALLAKVEEIICTGLAEQDFLVLDVGVLEKLRHSLIEPDGHPLACTAELKVGVLVVDGCIGVVLLDVKAKENVVFVRSVEEVASEIQ